MLAKYGQELQPEAGELLFGTEFTTKLKDQMETDSSLSKIIKSLPSHSQRWAQATFFSCTKQFFSREPHQKSRSQLTPHNHLHTN